jgi:hypothetical protein
MRRFAAYIPKATTMTNSNSWRDRYIDPDMMFPEDVDVPEGLVELVLATPVLEPPAGYRWKYLWCGEADNTPQADDLAMLLLCTAKKDDDYMVWLPDGSYACGNVSNRDKPWVCWMSFGIGCSMQSAVSEIFVAVAVNEDGTEKYPSHSGRML